MPAPSYNGYIHATYLWGCPGPYEIVSLIGESGTEEVFRARDTRLGRTAALKISKEKFGERFTGLYERGKTGAVAVVSLSPR